MPYPLAYRTRRIVFLLALLCPSATLAYIAIPLGDISLVGHTSTARTQDIVIPMHLPTARPAMPYLGARPWLAERGVSVRTAADNAAIDELALSTAVGVSSATTEGESRRVAAQHSAATGSGRAKHIAYGSSDTGYAGGGMATAGVWGGIAGVAANRSGDSGAAGDVASQLASGSSSSSGESGSGGAGGNGAGGSSTPGLTGRSGAGGSSGATGREGSLTAGANQKGRGLAIAAATPGLTGAAGAGAGQSVSSTTGSNAPSPNPEPASLLLMGGGLAAAYFGRRFVL